MDSVNIKNIYFPPVSHPSKTEEKIPEIKNMEKKPVLESKNKKTTKKSYVFQKKLFLFVPSVVVVVVNLV